MRILRVISSMDPRMGGPPQGIRAISSELLNLGVETEVVCVDNACDEYGIDDNFLIHKMGRLENYWRSSPALSRWLDQNLNRFDVVVNHGLWQYPSFATTRAVLRARGNGVHVGFFLVPHGMLDPWFQVTPSRRLKSLRNRIYWRLIEHRCIRNVDAILFSCERELLVARNAFRLYKPKHEINVGYAVEAPPPHIQRHTSTFQALCPASKKISFLLCLSRINQKKGMDLLIRAYAEILREAGDKDTIPSIIIVGPGEKQYVQELVSLAKTEGVFLDHSREAGSPGICILSEMVRGDEKWGAFYNCEAFVLPSHQENFGIAVVESLACGKPVLISDQINIYKEIESDGAAIVSTDDVSGTKKMILKWLGLNRAVKKDMEIAASECYLRRFQVAGLASRLAGVFSDYIIDK